MNDGNSNPENSSSDDSSIFSDDDFPKSPQIPQLDSNFDDINEFWNNPSRTITPKRTPTLNVKFVTPPHITPPVKSVTSNTLAYQATPPHSFQSPTTNFNKSPIYVGSSTEDTPRRSFSSESNTSSDEYSSDSSDGIIFIDTPISERPKQSPPESNSDAIFILSPTLSNVSDKQPKAEGSGSYSDYSSIESDVPIEKNQENDTSSYNQNTVISLPENQEISSESNNIEEISNNSSTNDLFPTATIPSGSDSDVDMNVSENYAKNDESQIIQTITEEHSNLKSAKNQKQNIKKQTPSKPAFASPKRTSNGKKKETIITELSPLTSTRRKKVERPQISDFRLSQLEEEEIKEKEHETTQVMSNQVENENHKEITKKEEIFTEESEIKYYENKNNTKRLIKSSESSDSNDSDNDIKKIERLAKKNRFYKKSMNTLVNEEEQKTQDLENQNETKTEKNEEKNAKKLRQNKSPLRQENSKSKDEKELPPQTDNLKLKKASPSPKTKSKSQNKSKVKSESQPLKSQPENKSKSKTKSKTKQQPESQPPKTKAKSPKSTKSSPNKSKAKSNTRYDFSINSDDDSDESRISSLVQLPKDIINDQKNKNSSNKDMDDSDLPIALRRRKRVIVKPLKFWCGEHIVYGLSEDGFQTFQNLSIPEKMRKLNKGESRVMMKEQKRILPKKEIKRKLTRVEGNGIVVFEDKVIDFDKSNEVLLDKGVKCSVVCKGDSPLIFKMEEM